jgi:hypothetical protein
VTDTDYRAAHERALAAARGDEEVLAVRTEIDDTYLDTLEVAITPPNGPLVTRVFRFADSVDGEPPCPPDVLGRIALWKVDVRGDDVQLLIDEVRRLRAAARPVSQGWWHPNVKSGQVHDHTAVQPQTMHRLCRPVALAPEARS